MAEIERLTGVELDITWVPEGVYTDKMNTALTTNSLGKVTFVKFSDYNLVKTPSVLKHFGRSAHIFRSSPILKHWTPLFLSRPLLMVRSTACIQNALPPDRVS